MEGEKLTILNIAEYNLIATKDPGGSYDRKTRENLYWVIEKLRRNVPHLSPLELRLFDKFRYAEFSALKAKDKKVKFEIARYRLSSNVKRTLKISAGTFSILVLIGYLSYEFVLDQNSKREVEVAYYASLNKVGLVSSKDLKQIKKDLTLTSTELEKARQESLELSRTVERMITNNKVTENLKYILKQIYEDPRARYVKVSDGMKLEFDGKEIATYEDKPELWYILGVVESGLMRVFYDNEEILEFRAIFGRMGEETPLGEYEVKNRAYKPTWYKKEKKDGLVRVREIPFGDPEHEIGHWWLGLRKLGDTVSGSYGIHGVNVSKVNEFYKKNFDWRNGSAGCPNIQSWYLHFLAKVLPLKTHVNIVSKDKWRESPFVPPSPSQSAKKSTFTQLS
tara:strand:- start:151 stop:1332 length:1182 start_codon:yes stop_codon:yes gene_type:complete